MFRLDEQIIQISVYLEEKIALIFSSFHLITLNFTVKKQVQKEFKKFNNKQITIML